jgi:hypothetical protein
MRTVIASILVAGLLVLLGGFAAIYAGAYDVAATVPHWQITHWVMETARVRSIKAHAAGIKAPPGLDDPAKVPMGIEHSRRTAPSATARPACRAETSPKASIRNLPILPKPYRSIATGSFSGSSRTASK